MASRSDVTVVNEVPDAMMRLVRMIVKAFYGPEYSVVIDLLIRNVSMREEELRELLKFEPKQLRTVLLALKHDKIVRERQEIEQRAEGRALRHNYYFVSYASMMNMIKYKLDQMRKRLESEENSNSNRPSFKCTKCSKVYSDLEISFLWNGNTMTCVYCYSEVVENEMVTEVDTSRTSLAKFNEQLWPVLEILISLDNIQLAPHLLEPDPPSKLRESRSMRERAQKTYPDGVGRRYVDGALHSGNGPNASRQQNVVISSDGWQSRETPKEIPVWMQASTISPTDSGVAGVSADGHRFSSSQTETKTNDLVIKLLAHETAGDSVKSVDEGDDEEEFEEVPEEIIVTVQGENKSLEELMSNPDLVNLMTDSEKERYVEVTQQAFQHYYMD